MHLAGVIQDQRTIEELQAEVKRLARQKNAVLLAHNYQRPEVQDVADFVGDSLGLSRQAAQSGADMIVFCGVHFMAETAAILAPEKTVLLPDLEAGCSLADTITADQLRSWKAEYPNATVVAYINTSADVKAESDIVCTSSNAVEVVQSIPEDQEILFLPDMFLGAFVERETGRKNMHIWMGECHVHAGLRAETIDSIRKRHPDAEFLIHPECGCVSQYMDLLSLGEIDQEGTHVLSTGHMLHHARQSKARRFVVGTETGILHRLVKENPDKEFIPVDERAVCEYMKKITLENVLEALQEEKHVIQVPEETAQKARLAIERMLAIG